MKKLLIIAFIALLTSSSFSQIKFEKGSLSDILAKAKQENKIVMVDVMTDWCKWCIELDNKVYSNADVSEFANANQVNFKIDAEKGEGVDFAKKYKVQGYPTVLFLKSDGEEIDRIYGYVPLKDFTEMMKDYNKGINTYPYLKDLLAKEPNNIEANLKMADKEMALGQLDDAKAHLNNIIKQDPNNTAGKTDDAKYRLASLADKSTIAKELETFISENPDSDVLKDAYVSLAETYTYALEDKVNGEKYYAKSLELFPNDDGVKSSYGQYLNGAALNLADKGTGESDYKKGLEVVNTALTYVAGSVNEASSYYIQSKLYYNLKEYTKAIESIDKALKIFDRKLYRDHKVKIEKQMSLK